MLLPDFYTQAQTLLEAALGQLIPLESPQPSLLTEGMRYALLGPGKRLRPLLVLATSYTVNGAPEQALQSALAIECIHAYSLVHDDLPAMDNDDLRRGRPTCHKQYNEGLAILIGDALLTLAFEQIAAYPSCVRLVAQAAGFQGMVQGQALDLAYTTRQEPALLPTIHHLKTTCLFQAAVDLGLATQSNISPEVRARFQTLIQAFGLCYQLQDDLEDAAKGEKTSFITTHGEAYTRTLLSENTQKIFSELALLPYNTSILEPLFRSILTRTDCPEGIA